MHKPIITFLAAVSDNGVIGANNDLPWYLPEDLKRFKRLTDGKTVVMGKKTFDSIFKRLGKPLPNRTNIVITRGDEPLPEGVLRMKDIGEALALDVPEVMIIGGGQIFKQLIDKADRLQLTHVHQQIDGDIFFPDVDWNQWKKTFEEKHDGYTFADYERT